MEPILNYFKPSEFTMGEEPVFDKMDTSFLYLLDALRENVNEPLIITSSYRSKEYNEFVVKGAKNSYHLKGKAVDIACTNSTLRAKIVREALSLGLTCGIANTFIHIDDRKNQIIFLY